MMTVARDGNKANRRTSWQVVSAVVAILLLSAYGTAFIYERMVSLDDEQTERLESWLECNRGWHRKSQLGRHADLLDDLAARQSPGVASMFPGGTDSGAGCGGVGA